MESGALFLVKLQYFIAVMYNFITVAVEYWILADILTDYFLPTKACFM